MKITSALKNKMLLGLFLCLSHRQHFLPIIWPETLSGYKITCEISGVPDGTAFFLVKNGGKDTVASTKIINGKFKFEGSMRREGELHFIKLDTTFLKLAKGKNSYVRLLLDHSKIMISGRFDQWPETKITGSNATKSFESLFAEIQKCVDSTQKICADIARKYNEPDRQIEINAAIRQHYEKLYVFFAKNNNSLATPLLIYNYAPDSIEYIVSLYNSFPQKIKDGYYAHCLNEERVLNIRGESEIAAGNYMPELNSLLSVDGKRVSILDIAKRGKITLIDFWASWCKPCRDQVPKLKAIYSEFRDRGFNIVGISQDVNKDNWLKAINDDGVEWLNLLDNSKAVARVFRLNGIPAYLLIDENGKMIAFSAVSSIPNFGPSLGSDELRNTIIRILDK